MYSQGEDLLSRVKKYESQMATALYSSNLKDKIIKEVQAEFGARRELSNFFVDSLLKINSFVKAINFNS